MPRAPSATTPPSHTRSIIDLSYAAAYKLGYADQGHASVEVALVLPEDVAFVHPARPIPPVRKARPAPPPSIAAVRQQPAPAVASVEASRQVQPELPVAVSVQPAVPPAAVATVAAGGRDAGARRRAGFPAAGFLPVPA